MLDRSKIQERLNALSRGNSTNEKIDYTKVFWKPRLGEQTIRIVPSKFNKDWPLQQVKFHNDIVVNRMLALSNFGEKDPIEEFILAIKAQANAKKAKGENSDDEWQLASKLRPKTRTYVQVVVRGEEHLGTRLWEFGVEAEKQILTIMNNPEYGDITDIHEGTDLNINGLNESFNGNKYVKPSISPRRSSSNLTDDAELLKKLLNDQHDPLAMFRKYSYAEIHANLEKWLEPEATAENTQDSQDNATTVDVEDNTGGDDLPFVPDPPKEEKKTAKKPLVKEQTPKTSPKTTGRFKEMFNK